MTEWEKAERMLNLKSDKVELALIDDIQKAMSTASKESSSAVAGLGKASAALDEAFTSYRQTSIYAKQALDQIDVYETKAKELGIDLSANVNKMKTDATNMLKFSQEKMKVLQSVRGQLK